ncbi:hypothetical protein LELG_03740 [Lodderomyces elongisporus NRRL YB-4239]|uniref:Bacterial surface antigen (D15) domain-containing protein n=1 Tax=Lodderomyces elongisporus (strain ATCC 11503 / CBS 2605 / JCM 1781 / NBRC 1676 / NRRL YB-4239) TaxID=379508 RepID=A5E2A3_LODEL|nr:hypothetical protein LELG_03740 [Lodderomyces elongisporus NRRL YB-4239]
MSSITTESEPKLQGKITEENLLLGSKSQPILLTRVEVNGGGPFSYEFFDKLLSPLLGKGDYTLAQITDKIHQSYQHLADTGVFKKIGARIEPDFYSNVPAVKSYNSEKSIPAKVVFDVANVSLNNNEGFLNFNNEEFLNLQLNHIDRNFSENAETVSVGVDYNPYKPYDHLLTNFKFSSSLKDPSFRFLIDGGYNTRNNYAWQDFKENQLGGKIGLLYKKQKNFDIFTGFSLYKRRLFDIEEGANADLKYFNGEFLKSSVLNKAHFQHLTYLSDKHKSFPTNGINVQIESELSSVQKQVDASNRGEFVKLQIKFDLYKSVFNNYFTTKLSGEIGGIYSFNSKFPVHPLDKFYLGGYSSFLGFSKNGVEPSGGLQLYKVQATLFSKIPHLLYAPTLNRYNVALSEDEHPLRLYGTVIAGNCVPTSSKTIFNDDNGALSYGFGLRYFNHWANFDLGYFVSKRFGSLESRSDVGVKDGIQFSISIGAPSSNL